MCAGHSVVGELAADTGPLSYPANTGYSRNAVSMLTTVCDAGPTLKQNRVNDPCLLGISYQPLSCGRGHIFSFCVYKIGESTSSCYYNLYDFTHSTIGNVFLCCLSNVLRKQVSKKCSMFRISNTCKHRYVNISS